jgi:hypothetical protein
MRLSSCLLINLEIVIVLEVSVSADGAEALRGPGLGFGVGLTISSVVLRWLSGLNEEAQRRDKHEQP